MPFLSHFFMFGRKNRWGIHQHNPLPSLVPMTELARRGGSFRLKMLDCCSSPDLEIIKRVPSWTVVMRVFIVHAPLEIGLASGLFGLLGDECVQIIDASDQERLKAYFDLAIDCEEKGKTLWSQWFRRESAETLQQKLDSVVIERFGSLEQAPKMHPAIMFRLCTRMCNHSSQADGGFQPLSGEMEPPSSTKRH